MLANSEFSRHKNNRLKRLIHNAGFNQPEVSIMDINYTSGGKLNKELDKQICHLRLYIRTQESFYYRCYRLR